MFINIASLRVYVLPESYEVQNKTLDDIKYVANPTYSKEDVTKLDKEVKTRRDLGMKKYMPGKQSEVGTVLMEWVLMSIRICGFE